MRYILACVLLFVCTATAQLPQGIKTVVDGTAYLYSMDDKGTYSYRCGATAFEHDNDTYRFLTAAHCLENSGRYDFFLTKDEDGNKRMYAARIWRKGEEAKGDDFAVLEISTTDDFALVPLGEDGKTGDMVFNIANPGGAGSQLFRGVITRSSINRPIGVVGGEWKGNVFLSLMASDIGSSGSAVICEVQEAICSVIVGFHRGPVSTVMVAVPISRFKIWYAEQKNPIFGALMPWFLGQSHPPTSWWMRYSSLLQLGFIWLLIMVAGFLWSNIRRNRLTL